MVDFIKWIKKANIRVLWEIRTFKSMIL
jgi:hypothetical protein